MKTDIIFRVMEVLEEAELFAWLKPAYSGTALSGRCFDARMALRKEILRELPDIEIKGEK